MEDFKATLARADMTMDDLVSVTIYCPDLSLYADFNAVYRQYFDGDFPPGPLSAQVPCCLACALKCRASLSKPHSKSIRQTSCQVLSVG